MRHFYVRLLRLLRAVLRVTGVLGFMDKRAMISRRALWLRSLLAIYDFEDFLPLGVPWWTFDASERVNAFLAARPTARVFEWGSGASTVWLSARAASVTSVEHDAAWSSYVAPRLPTHCDLRTVRPAPSDDPATPSHKKGFAGLDFTDYVEEMDRTQGEFDLVVVDGRAREACLRKALPRLTPGGMVLVDDVERRRYREAIAELGDAVRVTWTRGLKPCIPYPSRTALVAKT